MILLVGVVCLAHLSDALNREGSLPNSSTTTQSPSIFKRMRRIYRIAKLVRTILDPNVTLASLVPSSKGVVYEKVNQCYSAQINGQHVDIFKLPVSTVIKKFLVCSSFLGWSLFKDNKDEG